MYLLSTVRAGDGRSHYIGRCGAGRDEILCGPACVAELLLAIVLSRLPPPRCLSPLLLLLGVLVCVRCLCCRSLRRWGGYLNGFWRCSGRRDRRLCWSLRGSGRLIGGCPGLLIG